MFPAKTPAAVGFSGCGELGNTFLNSHARGHTPSSSILCMVCLLMDLPLFLFPMFPARSEVRIKWQLILDIF